MPMYDRQCPACGLLSLDHLEPVTPPAVPCPACRASTERVWRQGHANAVIGDEIDLTVEHGLCASDGAPTRFRSRTEYRRALKARGLVEFVRHTPGDRYVKPWGGIARETLEGAAALLARVEKGSRCD